MPDVSSLSAVQPRVLAALIQCATMATEVVEVTTESEEAVIINWVAIFFEKGKEGENFRKKKQILLQCELFKRQEGHNSRRNIYIPRSTYN